MNGMARHRPVMIIIVVVIAVIGTRPARAAGCPAASSFLHPTTIQDDYNASWQRLATYVKGLQAIDGQVSSTDLATVTASLNSALDHLDQAKNALDKGQTGQASANITQANAIMDAVDAGYQAMQAQARQARLMTIASWIGGIAITCAAIIVLRFIKHRRDKKKLREFLDAKIDYTGVETKPDGE